jgi:hypothetical protein
LENAPKFVWDYVLQKKDKLFNGESEMNKYAKSTETEQKKTLVFPNKWIGERIPEFVTIPPERKIRVSNMRNGMIILENGLTGKYRRVRDDKKTNERIIMIELEIENE